MPNRCVVRGCDKTGGFSFPTDPEVSLQWRLAVRRQEASESASPGPERTLWKPSEHSKVCSSHFKPEDFKESLISSCSANPTARRCLKLKDGSVPSVFPCSQSSTISATPSLSPPSAPTLASNEQFPPSPSALTEDPQSPSAQAEALIEQSPTSLSAQAEASLEHEPSTSTTSYLMDPDVEREEVINETDHVHVLVDIIQGDESADIGIQVEADCVERGAQTRVTGAIRATFSIKDIKDDPEAVKFYTSFETYDHFRYVLHCLGPNAYELDYKSRALDTEDEFFLFLVKLRLNHEDQDLSYRFGISRQIVSSIFHTWLNFLFFQLQEAVKFIEMDVVKMHMPKDFKAKYPSTRVILDATEVSV